MLTCAIHLQSVIFKTIKQIAFSQADNDLTEDVYLPSISVHVILMVLALQQQLKYSFYLWNLFKIVSGGVLKVAQFIQLL